MTKRLIASLVGALILFIWQFLSWSMLNIHGAENQYTPKQDEILEFLGQHLDEGEYFLPTVAPGSSSEDYQAAMEEAMGEPWATISYHPKMEVNMGLNMFRGFVVNFIAVLLLVWMILKFENLNFSSALLASLSVGVISYLTIPYLNAIWYESNTIGYVIDTFVQWGLVGVWLGWFLNR